MNSSAVFFLVVLSVFVQFSAQEDDVFEEPQERYLFNRGPRRIMSHPMMSSSMMPNSMMPNSMMQPYQGYQSHPMMQSYGYEPYGGNSLMQNPYGGGFGRSMSYGYNQMMGGYGGYGMPQYPYGKSMVQRFRRPFFRRSLDVEGADE